MYNRYVPQPDGSYRRNRVQDTPPPPPKKEPQRTESPHITQPPPIPSGQPHIQSQQRPIPPRVPKKANEPAGIGNFLKQLLPKDFDTEDLLIILLLLLMSGDCQEDQNTALLTLVLYLFV